MDYFFLLHLLWRAARVLEVAANPYVTLLGPAESSERRLNLAQSFKAVGAVVTPFIGALVTWYRSNLDPERLLPILSAYLGHVHVADTQWYLSNSPELMREAIRRLEHRWEHRP